MIATLFLPGFARADTFSPTPIDLWDLDHGRYYEWGITFNVPQGETIASASLFFDDIRDWRTEYNDLWVHLLDNPTTGVTTGYDGEAPSDAFAGQGLLLHHYENLPSTAQDITYTFDATELAALNAYAADGLFGFGFDPDCHFYNNGITLTIETEPVPVPGALLLGGLGLGSAVTALRRRRQA